MNKITNYIYIGDWESSIDRKQLIDNKIKTIICINDRLKSNKNINLYKKLNIKHYFIQEYDVPQTNLLKYFNKTNKIIEESIKNKKSVLVHCTMGISRSTTVVLAYLLYDHYLQNPHNNGSTNNHKLKIIYDFVKSKRSIIYPNDGFINQLKLYEEMLISEKKKKIERSKLFLVCLIGTLPLFFI